MVDDAVLGVFQKQLLQPELLRKLLSSVIDRSDEANEKRRADSKLAGAEKFLVEAAMHDLLDAIEKGAMKPSDPFFCGSGC